MDSFSQEEEKKLKNQNSDSENINDIQFEEIDEPKEGDEESPTEELSEINFDEIEQASDEIEQASDEIEEEEEEEENIPEGEISNEELKEKLESELPDINSRNQEIPNKDIKKYVVYVDSENVNFVDNLSINERKKIVNKILKEQNEVTKRQKQIEDRVQFIKHAIVASLTLIICFPILFFLVNKSLEATLLNYQKSRESFVRLYKEQGKIRPTEKSILGN